MLKDKLSKVKLKEKITGDELKKYIPDLKGIDYITKVSETRFDIEPTLMGSAFMSDDAYLEIKNNVKISGLNGAKNSISITGIQVTAYGVRVQKPVGNYKTSTFVIKGDYASFVVGKQIVSFSLK